MKVIPCWCHLSIKVLCYCIMCLFIFGSEEFNLLRSSPNWLTTKCRSFADYLDKSDFDSPKRKKIIDDSAHELSNEKSETNLGAKSIFKLEKPILSNENDCISFREELDNNLQIFTKEDVSRRK